MKWNWFFVIVIFARVAQSQSQCLGFYGLLDFESRAGIQSVYFELKNRINYKSTPMNPYFIGETSPDFHPEHPRPYVTKYLNAAEREQYRIVIKDGVFYRPDGRPAEFPSDHVMNYVMDSAGNFYIFDQKVANYIRHSSIFGGEPIGGAGEMLVVDGKLRLINMHSGHYPGSLALVDQVVLELKLDGVNIKEMTVIRTPKST